MMPLKETRVGGVLWVSSDGEVQMVTNYNPIKSLGLEAKTQKISY